MDQGGSGTVTERFAEQVRLRPAATALRFRGEDLTYAELDARSDRLALRLRALGVEEESVVAVCFEKAFVNPTALAHTVVPARRACNRPRVRSARTEEVAAARDNARLSSAPASAGRSAAA
nr:AMP-binding protein [Salinispora arenicola]